MPPVYIVEQGTRLSIEKRRLIVKQQDDVLLKVPLAHTSAIVLFGNIHITTPAMKRLLHMGVDTIFLTQDGRYEGRLIGQPSHYGLLRQNQYDQLHHVDFRLSIAKAIVAAKCQNMRTLLQRHNRRKPDIDLQDVIQQIAQRLDSTPRKTTLNALRGIEGSATAAYFRGFKQLLQPPWTFQQRIRRPPTDPVNVLLSFGYTLLQHAMEAMVNVVGLDPYIGVLHRTEYARPSLALDLIEPFRPILVDSVVLQCLHNGTLTPADFKEADDRQRPIVLQDGGKRRFIQALEDRLETEIKHPHTNERMTYRRALEIEARLLARCLREQNSVFKTFRVR